MENNCSLKDHLYAELSSGFLRLLRGHTLVHAVHVVLMVYRDSLISLIPKRKFGLSFTQGRIGDFQTLKQTK